MATYAVVKAGGKQYLVKNNDEIVVERVSMPEKKDIELETLAVFTDDGAKLELGTPMTGQKVKAHVMSHVKGDKVRIARFRAKVRYRIVKGFRAALTRLKVTVS